MADKKENCIRGCANLNMINRNIEALDNISDDISTSAKILNLAGNETRLKILYLIHKENNICVCDISDILNISISAVSQHLRKLKDGNLVQSKKEGQTIYYTIHPDFQPVLSSLFSLLKLTENKAA
tara:strand:- start:218 stop:595 length:378 start_codon:yes stop_codon:yes gene_type:complete